MKIFFRKNVFNCTYESSVKFTGKLLVRPNINLCCLGDRLNCKINKNIYLINQHAAALNLAVFLPCGKFKKFQLSHSEI